MLVAPDRAPLGPLLLVLPLLTPQTAHVVLVLDLVLHEGLLNSLGLLFSLLSLLVRNLERVHLGPEPRELRGRLAVALVLELAEHLLVLRAAELAVLGVVAQIIVLLIVLSRRATA